MIIPKLIKNGLVILAISFLLFFIPVVDLANAQTPNSNQLNNAPANNTQTKAPGATYVGRGVESSIRALLCAPTPTSNATSTGTGTFDNTNAEVKDNAAAGDLATCVNKGYRFALAFGAVASVFFVVLAGYMYMVGGEHGKEQAKEILVSVLAGFLIMLSSYVLLRQINPTLVAFRSIQPPQLLGKYSDFPSCSDIHLGLGEDCTMPDGSPGVSNGDGTGIPPQGGTMTGKSGKVCSLGKDNPKIKTLCSNKTFDQAFKAAGQANGIDPNFIKTIATIESNLNQTLVSWTGCCKGLMQMSNDTAARFGCTNNGWQTNGIAEIPCAAKYMKYIAQKAGGVDYVKIAAGYNAGEGRIGSSSICPGMIVALCPFKDAAQTACIVGANSLEQTRDYVVRMSRIYNEYKSQCGI